MLAKCSNPSCCALFLYLGEGRLFRLETDPASARGDAVRVEYYWLCGGCCCTMTLCLGRDNAVTAVPIPEPPGGVADGEARICGERRGGLRLGSVSDFWLEDASEGAKPRASRKSDAA